VESLKLEKGSTVADIGAGTGLFSRLFSEAVGPGGHVIAVDIAQNFLDHIAKTSRETNRKNIQTLLCTPESTNLIANSVDVAFICDTYHHFEFPLKTMRSLHAALKPTGRLFVIDFKRVEGESSEWTMNHVRAGQDVFEKEIVSSGFRKVGEIESLLKENYFLEFAKSEGR
jgi:ubiquinone/menaquinone biosynthesis C-methylase UbiE